MASCASDKHNPTDSKTHQKEVVMFQWLTTRVCNVPVIRFCQSCGIAQSCRAPSGPRQLVEIIDWCWCGLTILPHRAAELWGTPSRRLSVLHFSLSLAHWGPLWFSTTSQNQRRPTPNVCLVCLGSRCCWLSSAEMWNFPSHFSHMMFQGIASQICLTQNEVKPRSYCTSPKDDLHLNPYLDRRLHVEFGSGDESVLLVSRRQRSWMSLLSEIPEQENMQNFPKWVQCHYLMYHSALSLSQSGVFVT